MSSGGDGRLLVPGASRTPLTRYAARAYASLSLAYLDWPDNGGTMPDEDHTFTTHVDPGSPPVSNRPFVRRPARRMVEAPGTAPGSATPIPCGVYRHSRFLDPVNIVVRTGFTQASAGCTVAFASA